MIEKYLVWLPQTKEAISQMEPLQQGLGSPGACERLDTTLQQTVEWPDLPLDWIILEVDLSNAFNSVDRTAVRAGVAQWIPHLLPWACLSLSTPAPLVSPFGLLSSAQGVQQGSPMGPLFFNVAIHQAISNMPPELACNTWYMDDGTLVGPAAEFNLALSQLIPSLEILACESI